MVNIEKVSNGWIIRGTIKGRSISFVAQTDEEVLKYVKECLQ